MCTTAGTDTGAGAFGPSVIIIIIFFMLKG